MSSITGVWGYLSSLSIRRGSTRTLIRSLLAKARLLTGRHRFFFTLCDQGVVSVTNFATGAIIGRVCGKAELGLYTLAWTLIIFAVEVPAVLTTTPYTVFGPQMRQSRRRRYLGSVLVHQLLLSIVFASAMAVIAIFGRRQDWLSESVSSVVITTAGVIVFINLREFVRRVSFAELKIGWALVVDVSACLAQVAGVLLLLHFGHLTVSRTYALLGFTSAVAACGWLVLRWGRFRLDTRSCGRDFQKNWCFAKWVLGSWVLAAFAMYAYPWVLAAFHGTASAGIWAACSGIVALGNPILLGLGNHVGPNISNVYATSGARMMQRYVNRSSALFIVLLLPIVLVLAIGGERIVTGVYGKAYAGNSEVVCLLALNMLISALTYPYSRGLFSLERAKSDMIINVVAVTLLFTVGLVAMKSYAALGAAATLLTTSSITAAIRIGIFSREVRRNSNEASLAPKHSRMRIETAMITSLRPPS